MRTSSAGVPIEVKIRLDQLLVARGLVSSRQRAQAVILAGNVLVDEQKIQKAGASVSENAAIRMLGEDLRYVSRGGLKLEKALSHWNLDVAGLNCLDVGASTGGFTDCLLQHGAARVTAIDTGYGQIAMKLRQDGRVRLIEKCNARLLAADGLGEAFDAIVMDVSFISAIMVLPPVVAAAFPAAGKGRNGKFAVILVKPQFEVGRELVGKRGIVRDEAAQFAALEKVREGILSLGAASTDSTDSPILGAEGNKEFLLLARF